MKTIIYKENGVYKTTTEENYNSMIRDARKTTSWCSFENAEEIIEYCVKWNESDREEFIVIE